MRVITVSRVPTAGSVAQTALEYGTGGLNIDACRIEYLSESDKASAIPGGTPTAKVSSLAGSQGSGRPRTQPTPSEQKGRWPANLIHDGSEEVLAGFPDCKGELHNKTASGIFGSKQAGGRRTSSQKDSGSAARFFEDVKMSQELIDYLLTLIGSPDGAALYLGDLEGIDWGDIATWADNSIFGIITQGCPTEEQVAELQRVLRPGAHLLLIAPDTQPTGHTGACRLEDGGFEIRDSILLIDKPGRFHYVAKTSRSEREAGCGLLPGKTRKEWVCEYCKAGQEDPETPEECSKSEEGEHSWKEEETDGGGIHNHHPTVKPIKLMKRLLESVPVDEGIVIDPFMGCYDESTEVLTRRGWVFFSDTLETDEFITRQVGGNLSYQKASAFQVYDYEGEMISFKARSTDLLVTPNHNMLVQSHADFCAGRDARLIPAQDLRQKVYRIPCGGCYTPESSHLSREMMYLIGLYVSEGYLDPKYPDVIICQNRGEKNDQMLSWVSSFEPRSRGNRRFRVRLALKDFLFIKENCGVSKYRKFLSPQILSNEHLDALFAAMILGDGSVSKDGQHQYYTVSPRLADAFQEVCLKLGYDSTLTVRPARESSSRPIKGTVPVFTICVRRAQSKKIKSEEHISVIPYTGRVYCVTVPAHTLFVRRNGRTSWCGNSGSTLVAALDTGHDIIGIDQEEDYVKIADARVRHYDREVLRKHETVIESDHPSVPEVQEMSMLEMLGLE